MNVPDNAPQSQRMTDSEVKAVIRLWSERNKAADKPVDSRPSVADVAAALDIPPDEVAALLNAVRHERNAEDRKKAEVAQRKIQEQARIAREKQRLAEARKQADEKRKALPPGISIAPVSTAPPVRPTATTLPGRTPALNNRSAIYVAIAALAAVVLLGWLLSPPRILVQSSVNLGPPATFAARPNIPAPPPVIVVPPAQPVIATPPPAVYRPDPLDEARRRLQSLQAENRARQLESELRIQEMRARSEEMRARTDSLHEESRRRMDEAMERARALTGPAGIHRHGPSY